MKRSVITLICTAAALAGWSSASGGVAKQAPARGTIVFESLITGTDDHALFTIRADGSKLRRILRQNNCCAHVSGDGRRILVSRSTNDQRLTAAVINLNGSGYRALPLPPSFLLPGDAWSPDGSHVASGWGDPPAPVGLYMRRTSDGGGLTRVTDPGTPIAFSPDGSKILFLRDADDVDVEDRNSNLFVVNTDGTGLVRLNPPGTATGYIDTPVVSGQSWSPNGKQVAFVAAQGTFATDPRAAYVVNADGTGVHKIAAGSAYTAVWSPNGHWIAVDRYNSGSHELALVRPNGTGYKRFTSSNHVFSLGPVWSHDSHWLLFARGSGDGFDHENLWLKNADGTGLRKVTHKPGHYDSYGWSPR